ncbi:MAG: type II toxin-antitoxin system death-on-curing family toxin [Phycisphaeraceae bacterium]|nr:type II toxin-antitoxin system death-on-curing family toxin [Phycisphaeraceae bacterium]
MSLQQKIVFLTCEAVIELHARVIALYGGDQALRDRGLLESALAQPQAAFGGEYLHPTIPEMAAAYAFHLTCNHAFVDGNKRIGAYAAFVFLDMNDWCLTATQEVYEALILDIAAGRCGKDRVSAFFGQHARPAT